MVLAESGSVLSLAASICQSVATCGLAAHAFLQWSHRQKVSEEFLFVCPSGTELVPGSLDVNERPSRVHPAGDITDLSELRVSRQVGAGAASVVLAGFFNNKRIVIKKALDFDYEAEAEILRTVRSHSNIVRLIACVQSPCMTGLILEQLDCTLLQQSQIHWIWEEDEIRYIATGILSALQYLHRQRIVHRDVSPANTMLKSMSPTAPHPLNGVWKLIDFETAVRLGPGPRMPVRTPPEPRTRTPRSPPSHDK